MDILLQLIMLAEAFVKEAENPCPSGNINLPENLNLFALFEKFTEKKFDINFEKNKVDYKADIATGCRMSCIRGHMIAALISLFTGKEVGDLSGVGDPKYLKREIELVQKARDGKIGIITHFTDCKAYFIHPCFAEYFAAKWLAQNFTDSTQFISEMLYSPTCKVVAARNIFDSMLAEGFELLNAVLNYDEDAVHNLLQSETDVNITDNGGRTALHLAASYDNTTMKLLLAHTGIETDIEDTVLQWTPLQYAEMRGSQNAKDSLLKK